MVVKAASPRRKITTIVASQNVLKFQKALLAAQSQIIFKEVLEAQKKAKKKGGAGAQDNRKGAKDHKEKKIKAQPITKNRQQRRRELRK